eukprot:5516224-Amphidinium_carterae.2
MALSDCVFRAPVQCIVGVKHKPFLAHEVDELKSCIPWGVVTAIIACLLYTSDAADDTPCVDL